MKDWFVVLLGMKAKPSSRRSDRVLAVWQRTRPRDPEPERRRRRGGKTGEDGREEKKRGESIL
jgi:hypothetical protein